ncbi:hypothetical protein BCR39DRAFT_560276 [Naematelia encephala]|uniref:Arrestin-like N-terminal domain-containing protein n=1 Tax=Naematelia encephala TaxID=71784 RepID=A0A1Y2AXJ0_9TREE|nr:hypothetical protein BCR39DRAFT_560276 [Naematelia encephala]
MLRFLSPNGSRSQSPAHQGRSTSRRAHPKPSIRIVHHVPSYGSIFLEAPDPVEETVKAGREVNGELEIIVPDGWGPKRCKAIRVGIKSLAKLDMGPERGWEEDKIFHREVELHGVEEGIILHEGTQRFDFVLVIPDVLAPHDWHPNGRVSHFLTAEIEGLSSEPTSSGWFSPSTSRPSSPKLPPNPTFFDNDPTPPSAPISTSMKITWQEPRTPRAGPSSPSAVEWVKGTLKAQRTIMLLYNPDPNGGVTSLDVEKGGDAPGLGPFNMRWAAEVWTVCALLLTRVTLPNPSPATTIFFVRTALTQTTSIISPRDDPDTTPPLISTRQFTISARGICPPAHIRPSKETASIWRGPVAGGQSDGSSLIETTGRLPDDAIGRPSTLPNVSTPIRVTHTLLTELWFSVYGEDQHGNPLPQPGQGRLRVLKIEKPVVVPSCAFIPEVLNLPTYEAVSTTGIPAHQDTPCSLCRRPLSDQLCRDCPRTTVPHPRHDNDPKLVGNARGVCPLCEVRTLPTRTAEWKSCACGMDLEDMQERMRNTALNDEPSVNPVDLKIEEERGRRR